VPTVPAILGPTATGKTAVAVEVAERIGGEIVSVDSRQVYRGLAIGSGAPDPETLRRVPHHGIGILPPDDRWSAGAFARSARTWIREIRSRDRVPVLCGGTGFFFRALVAPVFCEPPLDARRRDRLARWLGTVPPERLSAWARRLDPVRATDVATLDPQRAARVIEVALLTGRSLSWWWSEAGPEAEPVPATVFVLELRPAEHRERIRRRVEEMLDAGWADETRRLLAAGHDASSPALSALGYTEVAAWARGDISRGEAVERIVRSTWAYARRQRTWFRHQVPPDAIRLDGDARPSVLARDVIDGWKNADEDGGRGGAA
jgi:tRNA dimethylallyltransferase